MVGLWALRGAPERDDGQVPACGVVADAAGPGSEQGIRKAKTDTGHASLRQTFGIDGPGGSLTL